MRGAAIMFKNLLIMASVALNGLLFNYLYFPESTTLAEVSSSLSQSKDYAEYYRSLGSYFTKDMESLTGENTSILYNASEGLLYLYDKDGPILSYGSNSIEVYPPNFEGSFHDRAEGMLYYSRDLNILSYYSGDRLEIGNLDTYPELIVDTKSKEIDIGLPSHLAADPANKVEKIFKNREECMFIEPGTTYLACCSIDQNLNKGPLTLAEGFVYWPFNEPRWFKIKENATLDQGLFDQVCNALYSSNISPDHELRKKLGEHFFNLDLDGFKNELQSAGGTPQD